MVFSSLALSEDVATFFLTAFFLVTFFLVTFYLAEFFLAAFFFAITTTPSVSWNAPPVSPPQPRRSTHRR